VVRIISQLEATSFSVMFLFETNPCKTSFHSLHDLSAFSYAAFKTEFRKPCIPLHQIVKAEE